MDFDLKQWREQQKHESGQEQTTPCAKLPRLHLDFINSQHQRPSAAAGDSSALPLFVTEPTSISNLSSNLSAAYPTPTPTKYSRETGGGMGSSYFSLAQWQELELQALIFRHMVAGAAVPPELLHHLIQKTLLYSSHHHPYYLSHHHPLHHYPSHLQPALLQSGYWGRVSTDPEPGRCRRTDGKKWRCSRDVVAGNKYCERHMHRGRNRSRKPVEIPTTHITPINCGANVLCGGILENNSALMAQSLGSAMAGGGGGGGGGGDGSTPHFAFSGPSQSIDSQRCSEPIVEYKNDVLGDDKSSGQILLHFFDDWPRSLQESENAGNNARSMTSVTNLSISISGKPTTSDFSLKLSTGDGDDTGADAGNTQRERSQSNWGANQVSSLGGPLAEALRSSASNSSPTSVLHQFQLGSASETSYVSS